VVNQEPELMATFKTKLDANSDKSSFVTAKALAFGAIDDTAEVDNIENYAYKTILGAVDTYSGEAEDIEKGIQSTKTLLSSMSNLTTLSKDIGTDEESLDLSRKVLAITGSSTSSEKLSSSELNTLGVDATVQNNTVLTGVYNDILKNVDDDDADSRSDLQDLGTYLKTLSEIADGTISLPTASLTNDELVSLGFENVSADTMSIVREKLQKFYTDNSTYPTYAEIQDIINKAANAVDESQKTISEYNTKSNASDAPTESDYTTLQITNLDASNLDSVNSMIKTIPESGKSSGTKVQSIVDIINYADDTSVDIDATDFSNIGLGGVIDSNASVNLMKKVIDSKTKDDIDTFSELQDLANTVDGVIEIADGSKEPKNDLNVTSLSALGITGLTDANLDNFLNQVKLQGTTASDTIVKLQLIANSDLTSPTLTTVTMASNNADTKKAGIGKEITLTIVADESIQKPTVTIAGKDANVTGSGANYSATYTVQSGDVNSNFVISNIKDTIGNPTSNVSTLNPASNLVSIDTIIPTLDSVTIASNDANTSYAEVSRVITVELVSSEDILLPSVTIAGKAAFVSSTDGSNYSATITVDKDTNLGIASISIDYTDDFGNNAIVSSTTDGTSVNIDSSIKIASATLTSNNAKGLGYVTTGNTITLNFATSIDSNGGLPTVTIAEQTATVTDKNDGDAKTFDATYRLTGSETEGNVAIVISDYVGAGGEIGLNVNSTTGGSSLIYDKTAPIVSSSQNTYTTQENNATTMSNFFSISANDARSGLRADSYGKSGSGVDDDWIDVDSSTGSVTLTKLPDYEGTDGNIQVQVEAQDNAGNVGYKDINITITDVDEVIIKEVFIEDKNTSGVIGDMIYIKFSEDVTLDATPENNYEINGSKTIVSSSSEYNSTSFIHSITLDSGSDDINESMNIFINIKSGTLSAVSGNLIDTSAHHIKDGLKFNNLLYGQITDSNGEIWLDRNLGANQVATSITDTNAYGDLYQWGRLADGHQLRSNPSTHSTTTLATDLNATNLGDPTQFIKNDSSPYDWVESGVDDDGSLRQQRLQ
jgi:hypothetical protein